MPNTEAVLELARACIARGQARLGARVQEETKAKADDDNGSGSDNDRGSDRGSHEEGEDGSGGQSGRQQQQQLEERVIVPGDLRPAERGGAQHLSLSRTAYLRSHHIDPFIADLRKALGWATRWVDG